MLKILKKELFLSSSILSFIFIIFSFIFLIPGYPILCSVFFVTLGIFQSFQKTRETNDILFSILLPINKEEVVKGKYYFVIFIELISFILMLLCSILRYSLLKDIEIYKNNQLMNANLFSLFAVLIIFSLFNLIFVNGFFKTAYKLSSFIYYIITCFIFIILFESLHHINGLNFLNSFNLDIIQISFLLFGVIIYISITLLSIKLSINKFKKINF